MEQENNMFSEMAKTGGKFIGNVLFLPVRATIYGLIQEIGLTLGRE